MSRDLLHAVNHLCSSLQMLAAEGLFVSLVNINTRLFLLKIFFPNFVESD